MPGADEPSSDGRGGAAAPRASVDRSAVLPGGGGTSEELGSGVTTSEETPKWSIAADNWSIAAEPLAAVVVGAIAAGPLAVGGGELMAVVGFGPIAAGPLGGGGGILGESRFGGGPSIGGAPWSAAPLVPGPPLRLRSGLSVRGLRRNTYAHTHTHTRSVYVVDL